MDPNERSKPKRSKCYTQAFKAQVLTERGLPGALSKEVALKHGIATSSLHKWRLFGGITVVRNKAVYLALGILPDGIRDFLGIWIEGTEGPSFG